MLFILLLELSFSLLDMNEIIVQKKEFTKWIIVVVIIVVNVVNVVLDSGTSLPYPTFFYILWQTWVKNDNVAISCCRCRRPQQCQRCCCRCRRRRGCSCCCCCCCQHRRRQRQNKFLRLSASSTTITTARTAKTSITTRRCCRSSSTFNDETCFLPSSVLKQFFWTIKFLRFRFFWANLNRKSGPFLFQPLRG